jgi:hypothetical protein
VPTSFAVIAKSYQVPSLAGPMLTAATQQSGVFLSFADYVAFTRHDELKML